MLFRAVITEINVVNRASAKKEDSYVKNKKEQISAKGFTIQVYTEDFRNDYISLTDIARYKNVHEPKDVVKN